MVLFANIAFGILSGWVVYWLLAFKARVDVPIAVVVGVLVGIVIYLSNFADRLF